MKTLFKNIVITIITAEARLMLRRHRPTIIGITGSVGKTSTKDAIYTAVKQHMHARKSEKSFNSDIGVALTILGLQNAWNNPLHWAWNIIDGFFTVLFTRRYPKVLILEMGVDRPGDMERLASWVRPHIAVLTRFPDVPVHVEYFNSPEEVVHEKMALVRALRSDGVVIYNHDDERIRRALTDVRQEAIGYSRYSQSQFTVSHDEIVYQKGKAVGVSCTLQHVDTEAKVELFGSLGVPQLYIAAAAAATACELGVPLTDATEALSNQRQTPGRLRLLPGANDTTIIDDSYNSSPIAAEQALMTLRELETDGRHVAVLGDMLELGKYSAREHERIGSLVPGKADVLITIGVRARRIAEGALEYGMSEKTIFQYDTVERAIAEQSKKFTPGDVILVKGSQSIRTEKFVKSIMKEKDKAGELLVRQDSAWQRR